VVMKSAGHRSFVCHMSPDWRLGEVGTGLVTDVRQSVGMLALVILWIAAFVRVFRNEACPVSALSSLFSFLDGSDPIVCTGKNRACTAAGICGRRVAPILSLWRSNRAGRCLPIHPRSEHRGGARIQQHSSSLMLLVTRRCLHTCFCGRPGEKL
jgi:hypothetical protein